MAEQRVQLPAGMKAGSREAKQFHADLIASLRGQLLDHQANNPGIARGTGPHDGAWVRPVAPDVAQANYAAALAGQPQDALAHLGLSGSEPITPEMAQAVAAAGPIPPEHQFAPDETYTKLHDAYRLAQLAPVAADTAFQAAGGPAAVAYLQTSKKPNVKAFEKFQQNATDVTPVLDAARKLRDAERGFGIDSQAPAAAPYKAALNDYLGPPPAGAPSLGQPAVAPPPANYGSA